MMRKKLLELFNTKAMVVGHSPLLNNPPNVDDLCVYVCWDDLEICGTDVITIPLSSLDSAEIAGHSVFVLDDNGEEVQVSFYDVEPTSLEFLKCS